MFDKILGNDQLKEMLTRLRSARRVPQSMIFAGPEGVGKRLFALELARSFVCREPEAGLACGECSACIRSGEFEFPKPESRDDFKKVIFSNHPDVGTVVAPNRNIFVDAIRDLEVEAHFRPYEGVGRTFIIDDADKMNDAAANALLKTLEEPPPTTHIILVTSRPDSMLATIRSRSQMLRFAPVSTDDIQRYLTEDRAISRHDAALTARVAGGSIGHAVSINLREFTERRDRMLAVVANAVKTDGRVALLRVAEEINDAKNKEKYEENLDILETLIHDVWSLSVGRDASQIANTDLENELSSLSREARVADLPSWLSAIHELRENFEVNVNRKIATDALFVKMAGTKS